MTSLHSLLNPEDGRRRKLRLVLNLPDLSSAKETSASPATPSESEISEIVSENQPDYSHKNHKTHADCPDRLGCLPDTNGRPQHTLPVILRCAILGSPQKKLTIREIYAVMESKYSYYQTAGASWKQSVRHHLSLNRLFERQPRPATEPGFGSYWTVNLSAPPGTKRPRKRGRSDKDLPDASNIAPTKRGRPQKTPESEDCTPRPSPPASTTRPQSLTLPPFSSLKEGSGDMVESLQAEVESLRRQSADAVSLSLRLSDQVAEAQAEASRMRATLRTVEGLLENETKKRREAERTADDEEKRRKKAEAALQDLRGMNHHALHAKS